MANRHPHPLFGRVVAAGLALVLAGGCVRAKPPQALPPEMRPPTPLPTPTGLLVLPEGWEIPSAPAGEDARRVHVVQPGDTLGTIAEAYGTTLEALRNANGLPDADAIAVGQEIAIPADALGPGPTEHPEGGQAVTGATHVVAPGDTLAALARRYETTIAAWVAANPDLADPEHLAVGQVLRVPAPAPAGQALPPRTHTVRRGESLYGIARRYGVEVDDIVRANGLANPAQVAAGEVLVIP